MSTDYLLFGPLRLYCGCILMLRGKDIPEKLETFPPGIFEEMNANGSVRFWIYLQNGTACYVLLFTPYCTARRQNRVVLGGERGDHPFEQPGDHGAV
jgi:hypothetical protein